MNKITLTTVLLIGLASAGFFATAQTPTTSAKQTATPAEDSELEKTLVALEKASWEAWKNRNASFFSNFLSDDHLEMHTNGVANKAAVLSTVATPACVVRSYSVDKFRLLRLNADAAVLAYYAEQDCVCNGKPVPSPAWVGSVYVRRDGKWLNVFYQQTPVK